MYNMTHSTLFHRYIMYPVKSGQYCLDFWKPEISQTYSNVTT